MLSGEEKGALLLKSLAPDVVQLILARLSPERSQQVRTLMNRLNAQTVSREALQEVVEELRQALRKMAATTDKTAKVPPGQTPGPGGTINKLDTAAASAPSLEEEPAPSLAPIKEYSPAEALRVLAKLPAERIALVFEGESARTTSIILNFLDDDKAGQVFSRLPAALRNEVSVQFSMQAMPNLDVLGRMAQALVRKHQRLPARTTAFPEGAARFRKMADMLRQLEKPQRMQVLENLEKQAPEAANEVKLLLYRFEDVLRLDNRSMQKVMTEIDNQSLAVALFGAADELREKFLTNLSKRAQDNLREEMELLRAPPKDEIEGARASITGVIQKLDLAGELVMTG